MRKLFFGIALLALTFSQAKAGFFSDLFERADESQETQFQEEVLNEDIYSEPLYQEEKVFSDEDFEELEEDTTHIKSKSIFLSYLKQPKKVYINQHFSIELKAIVTDENLQSIGTEFIGGKDFKVLNPNSPWVENAAKSHTNTYHIKLISQKSSLPSFKIVTTNARGKSNSETLKSYPLKLIALKQSEFFSNILATNFHLISHHEKKYDDKSNIVLLEINASESNLEDFHLPFAIREGIDSIQEAKTSQNIFYFAIVPNYQKELKFNYFNLNSNKFNRISFPIMISDSSISTQTDLNPQKSRFFLYKVIALLSFGLLFLLLYFIYRKNYLLYIALFIAIYTMFTKLITNNLTLPSDIMIRILPTENSTIFFKTSQAMEVKVLHKKDGYIKVLLPNTKIGWIKDVDLSKN